MAPVIAFPLAKLGVLAVKQISKPIAKRISAAANRSRLFKDWICVPTAQLFHSAEVKIKLRLLGVGKATKVPKMSEKDAVEQVRSARPRLVRLMTGLKCSGQRHHQ